MRRWPAAFLLAVLLLGGAQAHGQTAAELLNATGAGRTLVAPTGGPGSAPMSRPVDPAEYVVGPGDLLQMNLSGGVTRSWEALVLPEGTLYVPSVGPVQVTGLSLADARRVVLQKLASQYRGVSADLRLLRPRNFLIHVIGDASQPGALEVSATSRASEVLNESVFGAGASRRNVELRRRGAEGEVRVRMDMTRFRLTGVLPQDPLLREGDVLFIPRAAAEVAIEGAVSRAGRYELTPEDSLSTMFSLAGPLAPSATDAAVLVRFSDATQKDSLTFRVSDVLAGRFDTPMRDGDRVYIYFQPRFHFLEQVSISGEVQRPGSYPMLPGLYRLSDLVRAAGGFLPQADLSSLRVFRTGGKPSDPDPELDRLAQLGRKDMSAAEYDALRARASARRQDFRVDWSRVKPGGDLDVVLSGGDLVRVDPVLPAIRVEGEVRLPGLISHVPGRSVGDYIDLAGGFSERAARGKVRVKRAGTGQTTLARDVDELAPGDLVWVPERGDPQTWQNLQTLLLVAAQVATILLAIRAL